jgi:uroporphyrinogen decarboxylase
MENPRPAPPGKLLLDALRGRPVPRPPFWLMRQAGRYLPEYKALRGRARDFLDFCYTPELAVEATLQPIRRFGMDGAILFSDILVVPDALGAKVRFVEGEGPRLEPLQGRTDLDGLDLARLSGHLAPVYATIERLGRALPAETTLIGFAGAPWTLAAYMVEGRGSRDFVAPRRLARTDPALFGDLINLLTEAVTRFLLAQIRAGVEAVQVFDSWAGVLPEPEFLRWCVEPAARIVARIAQEAPGVPVILFPRGAGASYRAMAAVRGVAALGLDTTVPLAFATAELRGRGPGRVPCLQGNLDPVALLAGGETLLGEARRIVRALASGPFVFNLGHGVLPETNPGEVERLAEHLKSVRLAAM